MGKQKGSQTQITKSVCAAKIQLQNHFWQNKVQVQKSAAQAANEA